MDRDIENFVKHCDECNRTRPQLKDSNDTWSECNPWERIHIEWLNKPDHGEILVIVDAGSGWIEAFPCTDRSTRTVIRCLRNVFARFGVPFTLVSNNGKEFVSHDFKEWLKCQGCRKVDTPLYSPRSNGIAERAVHTLKKGLNFYNSNMGCSLASYLDEVLFSHRNSSQARGSTPAKLLLGHSLGSPITGY